MRASKRSPGIALVCMLSSVLSSFAVAQQSDRAIAERVLGPQWRQLSRRAGIIFAGTVLAVTEPAPTIDAAAPDRPVAGAIPAVQLSFRVDEAIAGAEPGQILTIHEWAGAWSMHRPMTKGQHILLFLYPLSRLGLTSPVGGSLGQIALDASGKNAVERHPAIALTSTAVPSPVVPLDRQIVSVRQLERAIVSARSSVPSALGEKNEE